MSLQSATSDFASRPPTSRRQLGTHPANPLVHPRTLGDHRKQSELNRLRPKKLCTTGERFRNAR